VSPKTWGRPLIAAALLGIYRPTLYSKLRKYGIIEAASAAPARPEFERPE
jgi:DNA-binding NtrC family response regulator